MLAVRHRAIDESASYLENRVEPGKHSIENQIKSSVVAMIIESEVCMIFVFSTHTFVGYHSCVTHFHFSWYFAAQSSFIPERCYKF